MPWYLRRGKRTVAQTVLGGGVPGVGDDLGGDICDAYCNTKFIDFKQ